MSVFDELQAHSALSFEQARMLPLEAYSSEAVLDAELATVFAGDWQCVARTADLKEAGDYVCADLPVGGGGQLGVVGKGTRGAHNAGAQVTLVCQPLVFEGGPFGQQHK